MECEGITGNKHSQKKIQTVIFSYLIEYLNKKLFVK